MLSLRTLAKPSRPLGLLKGSVITRLVSTKRNNRPATRFPTVFHAQRSASNPKTILPDGLVYNPAPSAPSPSITPNAFLPQDDVRKTLSPPSSQTYDLQNLPPLKEIKEKQYNLTEEDVAEMQRLRASDPEKWTRKALSEKFNCSLMFVSLASEASPEQLQEMDNRLEYIRSRFSAHKKNARRDRQRRRQLWLRDS